jgi:transposase
MSRLNYKGFFLKCQGAYGSGVGIKEEGDIGIVLVDLKRQEDGYICSGCGRKVFSKHSSWVQEVRHLHLWRYLTILKAQSERSLEGITVLGVDEISVGQGHNYWHLIKIIYDKFHVMRHLLNALNKIRKAEFRSAGKEMKRILTGRKFILLKRISNLRGKRGRLLRGY